MAFWFAALRGKLTVLAKIGGVRKMVLQDCSRINVNRRPSQYSLLRWVSERRGNVPLATRTDAGYCPQWLAEGSPQRGLRVNFEGVDYPSNGTYLAKMLGWTLTEA